MNYYLLFVIALALGLDAFSVSAAAGGYLGETNVRQKFRLAFHFGLFQALMPIIGWIIGKNLIHFVAPFDHWIAFSALTSIGCKMIFDSFKKTEVINKDVTKGFYLITLSIATSIDALAVGFTLGAINDKIVGPSIIIGIIASLMSLTGIKIGEFLSDKFGKYSIVAAGLALIIIGVLILKNHNVF